MERDTRSPLKAKALRTPGQSCEERRQQLFEEKIVPAITVAIVMTVLAGLEAWRAYSNQPPAPWIFAALALGSIAFALIRVRKYLPLIRNLTLGLEGEKAVGQYLERLRTVGYEVFHDLEAKGFNVDHALVGPAGVFAIETKTWRKPRGGNAKIAFDGESITLGGQAPDRDPIVQARAQADWLARLIEEGTGRKFAVKPVVLFPGWWIDGPPSGSAHDVWVLEPKALPAFLEHEPERLTLEQLKLVAFHLSRYQRTFEA